MFIVKLLKWLMMCSSIAVCFEGGVILDSESQIYGRTEIGYQFTGGRVLVCQNGTYSAICGNNWDELDAAVACRSLGYYPPYYGQ